jgi:uncharacterized membrane protein YedE/YeeE
MKPRPYWNPYVAGIVLGLVLLASFLLLGFGLGSTGATNRLGIAAVQVVSPEAVEANAYFSQYAGHGKNVLDDFMVFEVLGVFLGGAIGAYSGGRMRLGVTMGRSRAVSLATRFALAFSGGIVLGFAARIARGCTSGQALTGGALLSVGSWITMMALFAGAYAVAPLVRRQWR